MILDFKRQGFPNGCGLFNFTLKNRSKRLKKNQLSLFLIVFLDLYIICPQSTDMKIFSCKKMKRSVQFDENKKVQVKNENNSKKKNKKLFSNLVSYRLILLIVNNKELI